jgi:hypothetical protein
MGSEDAAKTLDPETIVPVFEPLAIDTVHTSRYDEPYEKRNP